MKTQSGRFGAWKLVDKVEAGSRGRPSLHWVFRLCSVDLENQWRASSKGVM